MTAPSRRDRTRPAEFIALSGILALFVGLVVLMSTRDFVLALIFTGIAFIVALIGFAMIALAVRPSDDDSVDLDNPDRDSAH